MVTYVGELQYMLALCAFVELWDLVAEEEDCLRDW